VNFKNYSHLSVFNWIYIIKNPLMLFERQSMTMKYER